MTAPLTRYATETVIVSRTRGFLTRAKMAAAADPQNPNADLNDPLATALEELGLPPADRSLVTDADLLRLPPDLQARYIDLAELRVLESCVQYQVAAPQSVQWLDYKKDQGANYLTSIQAYLKDRWDRYLDRWARSGGIAVGHMRPQNRHNLDPRAGYSPFLPPFPGSLP